MPLIMKGTRPLDGASPNQRLMRSVC